MIKNYFKTSLRFLKQNKLFACINVFGLSVALAASFILLLYVINERSYDHCHKNRKSVYRMVSYYTDLKISGDPEPYILGTTMKEKFPQIEKVCRIMPLTLNFKSDNGSIKEIAISTDSDIFNIFTLPLIEDSPKINLLDDKNSIAISLDLAKKLFGSSQNVVGKKIVAGTFDGDHILTVSGVFANIPENSTFKAQCIINSRWSVDYINKRFYVTNAETSWDQCFWTTWVLLSKDCDAQKMTEQINTFTAKKASGRPTVIYSLQNLSDVYFGSVGSEIHGNSSSIKIFSALAFLITVVAAINYIILSVAISTGRMKEIAIRKAFGAGIEKIKGQFLSESLLLVGVGLPFAFLLMFVSMPIAGNLLHTQLHIMKSNIILYVISYLALVIVIGTTSGFYTSMYLSKLNVLDILNNVLHSAKRKFSYRSLLIILQLMIFCSFMSGALLIHSQYKYVINKNMGFNTKNILLLDLGGDFHNSSYLNIINANPNVITATGTNSTIPIVDGYATMENSNPDNKEIKVMVNIMDVDLNFIRTMGLTIVEGRDFSEEYGSDKYKSCILNETAVKQLGITDPVGKIIEGDMIIGVVKDFNLFSLYREILPMSMIIVDGPKQTIAVHYKEGTLASIIPTMEAEWKKIAPDRPFKYTTIESNIENLYAPEKNLSIIVTIFSFLTLIIAAFGLFGLTLFLARSRTREIGIKKVFGSSENGIVFSAMKENFIHAIIGSMLAIPITIHFITQWLKRFAFKTSINWWVFVIALLTATLVVSLTVLYHSYKMARINPVDALKSV